MSLKAPDWIRYTILLAFSIVGTASGQEKKVGDKKRAGKRKVAVLIFEGVELLDFAGPAEVFIVANYGKSFEVFTVAASTKPIKTMGGIRVMPDYDYKNCPAADVLVIPGGGTSNVGEDGLAWIVAASKKSEIVMSVCYGAFLMARAKLLDGKQATTHHWAIKDLARAAPKCKVIEDKRFVDSGKIVTTAGVTAGIDGALHVVERLLGKAAAKWTAEEWMEHRRK